MSIHRRHGRIHLRAGHVIHQAEGSMAMAATRCWPSRGTCGSSFAGATWAATSMGSPRPGRPLSPLTRIAGPAGSRKRSVVAPPRSGARFARAQPASARSSRTLAARQARAYQPKDQARRGDSLRVVALGRTVPVPRQRPRSTSTVVARTIRPRALTRKNALFADSDGGAEHWAVIAALIEICKLIGVEPSTTWPTSHPHRRWPSQ
jgi:hypothetical protein